MTLSEYNFYISIFMFFFGAIWGSFGNVVIARLPAGISVVTPRSRCPKCMKPIAAYDNIPILSYFILQGKCRGCRNPISFRYPLVEFICGSLFVALYLRFGFSITLVELCIFCWAGVVASFIDLDHRILPDVITLSGCALGLLGAVINPERHFLDGLMGFLLGGGFLWMVAFIYSAIKKEEGMGGGDIKLIAWIGAVMGWKAVIFSVLVSSITGSIVGLSYAAFKKSGLKTAIPFGPFLVFAAIMYIFFGQRAMTLYLSAFFPYSN